MENKNPEKFLVNTCLHKIELIDFWMVSGQLKIQIQQLDLGNPVLCVFYSIYYVI